MPINFIAVRLAEQLVHPRVLGTTGGSMPGDMRLTFMLALIGMALLYATLFKLELTSKHARMQIKRLRKALDPPRASSAVAPPRATVPAKPEV